MVWLWTQGTKELRLEMRYEKEPSEFVVTIVSPDGSHSSERFKDIAAFKARLVALEQRLEGEHWKKMGRPLFVPEGLPAGDGLGHD